MRDPRQPRFPWPEDCQKVARSPPGQINAVSSPAPVSPLKAAITTETGTGACARQRCDDLTGSGREDRERCQRNSVFGPHRPIDGVLSLCAPGFLDRREMAFTESEPPLPRVHDSMIFEHRESVGSWDPKNRNMDASKALLRTPPQPPRASKRRLGGTSHLGMGCPDSDGHLKRSSSADDGTPWGLACWRLSAFPFPRRMLQLPAISRAEELGKDAGKGRSRKGMPWLDGHIHRWELSYLKVAKECFVHPMANRVAAGGGKPCSLLHLLLPPPMPLASAAKSRQLPPSDKPPGTSFSPALASTDGQ
ncbi:hypothetical protein BDK51DRAFT_41371 [Blyttiomyces helicus]|uniref:Uncharacterized protein n=1 Tax=Blyttiomyces helicus TaxID=388810 RepID=A0A4V1IRD5_9FUNG|nr:hypothetical protein BDK51DRAFT_41371 [Blyttiomyces helicus]|eukprot:RKO89677.1 hypothetical protein BDK51DRAFT_41371 [Blyttiomyces helicus]